MRRFDHIDLRVVDIAAARAFYEKVCAALGFPHVKIGPEWTCFSAEPEPKIGDYIALTEDRSYKASSVCHALWAQSKADVDRIARVLLQAGAGAMEGPDMFYRGHYAVFFEDPSGNRFEVCYREYTHSFDSRIADEKCV